MQAQKTTTPITGISIFKLGDPLDSIHKYSCNFTEISIRKSFDFSDEYKTLDSNSNFCAEAKVFYCPYFEIDEFSFLQGVYLTYLENRLIDIRLLSIISSSDPIVEVMKLKYGISYGKIYLTGYQAAVNKCKAQGIKITSSLQKQLEISYLSSVFWNYKGTTLYAGGSNRTYDFLNKAYETANLSESGLRATDEVKFQQLIKCSNSALNSLHQKYLITLKEKSKNF